MARIYPDSKTFVDKKLKYPPNKIIKNFESLLNQQQDGSLLSVDQIKQFVQDHFDEEGQELEPWIPGDMTIIFVPVTPRDSVLQRVTEQNTVI